MTSHILADVDTLREFQGTLSQFHQGAQEVIAQVASQLAKIQQRIEERTSYWQAELRRREAALNDCTSGERNDCRREHMMVEQALEALQTLRRLSAALEQSTGEYHSQQNRFSQVLSAAVGKGKTDLDRSIQKYEESAQLITIRPHFQNNPEVDTTKEGPWQTSAEVPKAPKPPEGWRPGGPEGGM